MESRNYFHQDGAAVTASSYSSRHNLLVAGLSMGMFGRRYSVGIRLEPIVRPYVVVDGEAVEGGKGGDEGEDAEGGGGGYFDCALCNDKGQRRGRRRGRSGRQEARGHGLMGEGRRGSVYIYVYARNRIPHVLISLSQKR